MDEKKALEAAAEQLHCEPGDFMAWAWRTDNLVVIGPTGQKFVFTPDVLKRIERDTACDKARGDPNAPAGIAGPKSASASRPKGDSRSGVQKTRSVQDTGCENGKTDGKKTPRPAPPKSKHS